MIENIILSIVKAEFGDFLFDAFQSEMRARQVVLHYFRRRIVARKTTITRERKQ